MINSIIAFSIRNKLIIGLMIVAWIGAGVWAMSTVNLGSVPDITNNQVQVIDARSVLNEYPGVFIDNAHFDERGHRIAADLLTEPLKVLLATPGSSARSESL